jgi:hypothetical protein
VTSTHLIPTTPTVTPAPAAAPLATRRALSAIPRTSRWFACAAACLSLTACSEPSSAPAQPGRFTDPIAPLAAERCDGCHAASAPGGVMSDYRNARPFITPGKPDESLYYTLPKGHPAAWGDSAGLVRAWIEAGAPE